MKTNLKKVFREQNLNPNLIHLKSLVIKKYMAKFAALKAKYADLRLQMFKELFEVEQKFNDDISKSIQKNNQKFK